MDAFIWNQSLVCISCGVFCVAMPWGYSYISTGNLFYFLFHAVLSPYIAQFLGGNRNVTTYSI